MRNLKTEELAHVYGAGGGGKSCASGGGKNGTKHGSNRGTGGHRQNTKQHNTKHQNTKHGSNRCS